MKAIETFFTSGNFDSKNITNKSNKFVSQKDIDLLESDGATYELLEKLDVPVFKYKTQITIHGIFPELSNNYIGRYKNLFQNKNLSIGCKYTAIDRFKKKNIFSHVCKYMGGWGITDNSTEYSLYMCSKYFRTKEDYAELLPLFQDTAKKINTKLFFGGVDVYLSKSFFGYFMVLELNIGAIKDSNVIPLIENICGASMSEIELKIENDAKTKQEKRDKLILERKQEDEAIKLKTAPYFEKGNSYLSTIGYVKETIKIVDGLVVCSGVSVNKETLAITYKMVKYTKTKTQKQFRYSVIDCVGEIPSVLDFRPSYNKTDKVTVDAYIKAIVATVPTVLNKDTIKQKNTVSGVKIVDYSEKSFAVIGETKEIKEILKELGGFFNFRLTCGAGWIFPKKSEVKVRERLKL